MDTGACILFNLQFNLLIKQERVLSQEAVKIKANEKWLYLTLRICIFPGNNRVALLSSVSFLDKSIKRKGLD